MTMHAFYAIRLVVYVHACILSLQLHVWVGHPHLPKTAPDLPKTAPDLLAWFAKPVHATCTRFARLTMVPVLFVAKHDSSDLCII